jgi:hypothetical protein
MNARVALDELVTAADIGRRIGVSTQRAHQLAELDEFPDPLGKVGRSKVWRWNDVARWQRGRAANEIRMRQPLLTIDSAGYHFETEPAQPGTITVSLPNGEHADQAVAWIGSPILELHKHPADVTVVSGRFEGEITSNTKGNWTLSGSRERAAA